MGTDDVSFPMRLNTAEPIHDGQSSDGWDE